VSLPSPLAERVEERLARMEAERIVPRIWERDHTVWAEDPREIRDRLGWLDVAEAMRDRVGALRSFASSARADGLTHVVLCGMGGSSLAPEVLAEAFGTAPGGLELVVLDTTHPDHLLAVERTVPPDGALFLISSKSGTTVETRSHLDYFWGRVPNGSRFAAITDPGTPLESLGRERAFREVFLNPPDIGGRYSALSLFGLVPAALLGVDLEVLLEGATSMAAACGPDVPARQNPAARLGAILGEAATSGRDKLTLVLPDSVAGLGAWIEQLVAESTGKDGRGILPVTGEEPGPPEVYGHDRLFVAAEAHPALEPLRSAGHPVISLDEIGPKALGAEFFRWELAVAVAGAVLGIHPFDQPNVQQAKEATEEVLASGAPPDPGFDELEPLLDAMAPPDYLAIQAYLPRNDDIEHRLQTVRMRLRDRLGVATTVGFGPRFLHSTGQLHKGGPPTGVFVQVDDEPVEDAPIPGRPYTFGELIRAQALGDLRALRSLGRRVARVRLSDLESA
jgi:transaldolase/glucose-6-phosphate isomerase